MDWDSGVSVLFCTVPARVQYSSTVQNVV